MRRGAFVRSGPSSSFGFGKSLLESDGPSPESGQRRDRHTRRCRARRPRSVRIPSRVRQSDFPFPAEASACRRREAGRAIKDTPPPTARDGALVGGPSSVIFDSRGTSLAGSRSRGQRDSVAHVDLAPVEDLRSKASPMDEAREYSAAGETLEMGTRFTKADSAEAGPAHPGILADEVVQRHA